MTAISEEMRTLVSRQRLGFMATVCADGSPNLSPKGQTFVLDADHIVVGEVRSPRSVTNLRERPMAEINVVDPVSRKGFRFKGPCVVHDEGSEYERLKDFIRQQGAKIEPRSVVVMTVERAAQLISPAYDTGATELEIREYWLGEINKEP
ncbi:MAG: pyridoxamine 5'-phosphate oxidase family protein [Pseudomonadales bacterium]